MTLNEAVVISNYVYMEEFYSLTYYSLPLDVLQGLGLLSRNTDGDSAHMHCGHPLCDIEPYQGYLRRDCVVVEENISGRCTACSVPRACVSTCTMSDTLSPGNEFS